MPDRYTYPDSEVLRNLEGIEDPAAAHAAETTFAYQRLVELEQHPIPGQFDLPHLQAIHRDVYQDLWQWAGELRTVDTGTTNTALVHCRPDFIEDEADRIFADLRSDDYLRSMSHERVADRLAYHWGETTVLHPFRDGNSRSQRAFFHQLTREAGWRIDWHGINAAMEQFKHARLVAHAGDHRSLAGVLGKHIDRSANSADTAPGLAGPALAEQLEAVRIARSGFGPRGTGPAPQSGPPMTFRRTSGRVQDRDGGQER